MNYVRVSVSVRRTFLAADDYFIHYSAVGHVLSVVEKGLRFLIPMKVEHSPNKFFEYIAVWNALRAHDG